MSLSSLRERFRAAVDEQIGRIEKAAEDQRMIDEVAELKSRVERLERDAMQRLFHENETTKQIERGEVAARSASPWVSWVRGPDESPESYGARLSHELEQMTKEKEQLESALRVLRHQVGLDAITRKNCPPASDSEYVLRLETDLHSAITHSVTLRTQNSRMRKALKRMRLVLQEVGLGIHDEDAHPQ